MNRYLVDTNFLLDSSKEILNYPVVIVSHTLREVEKLETKKTDKQLQYQIRQLKRVLEEHSDLLYFDLKDYKCNLGDDFDSQYVDNILIQVCLDNNYGLITNDILLKQKAKLYNIEILDVVKNEELEYTGYKIVNLNHQEMADFYQNLNKNKFNLLINQYIIIKNEDGETVDKLKWDGNSHKKLVHGKGKFLKPQNELQELSIDLLMDTTTPIKFIVGTMGSGKTYLATKSSLYHVLERGNQSKIMVVRNPLGSGESIGWLKGTKEDKTADFFKPFVQHLEGGEQEAIFLEQRGILTKEIPYFMKGLSIEDTFMIVDEAEDLDSKLIKLIGTRLGQNSCAVFSGDYKQAEDKFILNNGLLKAIDSLKGNKLVGVVFLEEDIRSEASKLFAEME
jgi:PhoH-like ATPase